MSHQTGITGNFCCIIQPDFKYAVFYTIKKTQKYLSAYNRKYKSRQYWLWEGGGGGYRETKVTFMTVARPNLMFHHSAP